MAYRSTPGKVGAERGGMQASNFLWVAVGGAAGSMARYWVAAAVALLTGPRFPWGTLLINVLGSFIIGWFGALTAETGPLDVPQGIRLLVLVGFCGGFTTFSSFSLQTFELIQSGEFFPAAGYVLGSVALCLLFVWFGAVLGR